MMYVAMSTTYDTSTFEAADLIADLLRASRSTARRASTARHSYDSVSARSNTNLSGSIVTTRS